MIVVRRKDSNETSRRKGMIQDWKGRSLTLSSNGRDREIDNDEIVEVQTRWLPDYAEGLKLLGQGKSKLAIPKLQSAISADPREWAKRTIRADLVRALLAVEDYGSAIEQFLVLVEDDPQTRFFHLCPLPWIATNHRLEQTANQLMKSNDPVRQLIGAGWSLAGGQQETAIRVLEQLSQNIDARIQQLAIMQLWRTRALTASPRQVAVWEKNLDSMEASLRPGPWLLIADCQSRLNQEPSAIINLMRIPILYPEQRHLAAVALYRAGRLLQNTGQTTEAQSVWNELRQKHAETVWATQAPALANPKTP